MVDQTPAGTLGLSCPAWVEACPSQLEATTASSTTSPTGKSSINIEDKKRRDMIKIPSAHKKP